MTREHILTITKKDFEIKTFRSGGPGGQHQNKTDSGVRIIHKASGAVGESRTDRSQYNNKRLALKRLTETGRFKLWIAIKVREMASGKTIEQQVEEALAPENIKFEIVDSAGKWIEAGIETGHS
jgi:protein subunit release factor B